MRNFMTVLMGFIIGGILTSAAYGQDMYENITSLKNLSIEELMDIEVVLASRKSERFSEVPAAIYVITGEDIRRSGALNIAEALRMVPGLHVGRTGTSSWVVSSRGFTDTYSNKLLVQIDGRSVYTPLFSGVEWGRQLVMLEDIDRIEVIRGPGASMWGANAVNGIINIVTKSSRDTQGGLVSGGNGTYEKSFSNLRYGSNINGDVYYRFYGEHIDRKGYDEDEEWKGWRSYSGGFRIDRKLSAEDSVAILGGIYENEEVPLIKTSGLHLLSQWKHKYSDSSDISLQLYYDRISEADHSEVPTYRTMIQTFDADFQHRFRPDERHEIVWGLGARAINDKLTPHTAFIFVPEKQTRYLYSFFLQDELTLIKDKLRLILGSKFEHNDYTGFEIQPNIRLLWTPDHVSTVWAAASRAARTPSRAERSINLRYDAGIPDIDVKIFGTDRFKSEILTAYEAGYRIQPSKQLAFDLAAFYNIYDKLMTIEQESPFVAGGTVVVPNYTDNKMNGKTYGIELAAYWQPYKWWTLKASYSYLQMQLNLSPDSTDTMLKASEGKTPHNQFSLLSLINISKNIEFDTSFHYADSLPALDIGSYFIVNARLGWKPVKNLDISLYCQNLFDKRHREFGTSLFRPDDPSEIARETLLKLTWRF